MNHAPAPHRIDAHVHFWDANSQYPIWVRRKVGALQRDFLPNDLAPILASEGVDGVLVVQAAPDDSETDYLLRLAEDNPLILGVIGWVDLEADERTLGRALDRLLAHPKFKGVRAHPKRVFDPKWLTDSRIKEAYRLLGRKGVPIDLAVSCLQLPQALKVISEVPEADFIVNHCGRPFVMTGETQLWASHMKEIAKKTNAYCKLSGLVERGGVEWSPETLKPWILSLLESFGVERLIFASNWPIVSLMGTYDGWMRALSEALDFAGIGQLQRSDLFARVAQKVYSIKDVDLPNMRP